MAAYSLRAREGLPVSVPIWREELPKLKSANQWNIGNLQARLAQVDDPWAELGSTRQSITLRMRKQLGIA
ncbi:ATP-dependent DNA ligase [compost metagenome]